jgi:hypothetical protein
MSCCLFFYNIVQNKPSLLNMNYQITLLSSKPMNMLILYWRKHNVYNSIQYHLIMYSFFLFSFLNNLFVETYSVISCSNYGMVLMCIKSFLVCYPPLGLFLHILGLTLALIAFGLEKIFYLIQFSLHSGKIQWVNQVDLVSSSLVSLGASRWSLVFHYTCASYFLDKVSTN